MVGGAKVASRISDFIDSHKGQYQLIAASRDWHDADNNNSGHFAAPGKAPNFETNWPVHCVAGTLGANYHPNLSTSNIEVDIFKGQGSHGYSIFEGVDTKNQSFRELLNQRKIQAVDVVGIATDHCVRASALDAKKSGLEVRVISSLTAGVSPASVEAAIDEMIDAGIEVVANL